MLKKYQDKRKEAEARLSQFEVDYKDPLDFLDKAIVVSSALSYLHERFDFKNRKSLLRAVFERIEVRDKEIVDVKLNPPFSILLRDDLEKLFKKSPSEATKEDIFEQLINTTFSENIRGIKQIVDILLYSLQEVCPNETRNNCSIKRPWRHTH
jgi:hypothetical protein